MLAVKVSWFTWEEKCAYKCTYPLRILPLRFKKKKKKGENDSFVWRRIWVREWLKCTATGRQNILQYFLYSTLFYSLWLFVSPAHTLREIEAMMVKEKTTKWTEAKVYNHMQERRKILEKVDHWYFYLQKKEKVWWRKAYQGSNSWIYSEESRSPCTTDC